MKTLNPEELYANLNDFLKSKGIELKKGVYAERIRKGCGLLAEAINTTEGAARRARVEVDKKLDQLRQSIHRATAPKSETPASGKQTSPGNEPTSNRKKRGMPRKHGGSNPKSVRRKS